MCVQGAWAAHTNHAVGPWIVGRAAVVQGICSFGMTYAVTRLITWLAVRFRCDAPEPRAAKSIVLAIGWGCWSCRCSRTGWPGTPHIAAKIPPAASLGTI
ncbi:hypothetical protein LMG9964_06617 [Paraburkholderia phenoliruptrix]|nr:hypothetical protein LMG9964_06617 [Paraburkholderia phenoliruptrix]